MMLTAIGLFATTILLPVRLGPPPAPSVHCTGIVLAEPQGEPAGPTLSASLREDETADLELARSGRWLLSLQSDSCWAAPVTIDVAASAVPSVELRRWPKGVLTGSLLPSRLPAPHTLELELRQTSARNGRAANEPLATVACPVVDGAWTCGAPSTPLDVRIGAQGFAPAYFWNVQFEHGRLDLSRVSLSAGGSVIGWVEDRKGDPVAGAEVILAPQSVNRETARLSGQATQTRQAVSNERGFFQFREIGTGTFTIAARTKAHAIAAPRDVQIRDSTEQRLTDPFVIEPPAEVVVQISPPLSPDRQPWDVRLSRLLFADRTHEPNASGRASDLGAWSTKAVERGPYSIEVADSSGSVVAQLNAVVNRDTTVVDIEIGKNRVEGRVRFGVEPIAADLKFSSEHGSVRMTSGEDGIYSGWLPKEGSWNVQVTPKDALQRVRKRVDVHVPAGETHAAVNIDLPAGRLEGFVVDEQGKPAPETEVLVMKGTNVIANAGTDREGHFVVAGLDPGSVVLQAKNRSLSSEYHPCTVTETAASKETLVLRAPAELKGRVVHSAGGAVVGALIRYLDGDELLTTASGPAGEFSLALNSGARFADIIVIAPQLPILVERVALGGDEKILVIPDVPAVVHVTPKSGGTLPVIAHGGTGLIPLAMLFAPRRGFGAPPEVEDGAFAVNVAPGQYNVCYAPGGGDCVPVAAHAGTITRVSPPKAEGGP